MAGNQDFDYYWFNERRKGRAFEEAASEAKRELFPELFFSENEPSVVVCRVCGGDGFHKPLCKLKNPDGKEHAQVDDIIQIAPDKPKAERSAIEVERERLERLKNPNLPAAEQSKDKAS